MFEGFDLGNLFVVVKLEWVVGKCLFMSIINGIWVFDCVSEVFFLFMVVLLNCEVVV